MLTIWVVGGFIQAILLNRLVLKEQGSESVVAVLLCTAIAPFMSLTICIGVAFYLIEWLATGEKPE